MPRGLRGSGKQEKAAGLPCQRVLFDIPEHVTYLNCAYMSPLMRAAAEAGAAGVNAKLRPWEVTPQDFFTLAEECRTRFAELMGVQAGDIALVPAVSYGVAVAARNLPLKSGQCILLLEDEFPSNVYIWQKLAAARGARVHVLEWPENGDWTAALLAQMDERTGIVAVPHCHWTDGSRVDVVRVGARCREIGAALVVDGTQSIGAMPLDIQAADPDFVVAAGYKWLLGPYSFGYLYVAPRRQEGEPLEENWINREGAENFARLVDYRPGYQPGARRFDVGERSNFALTPIALAGLEQLLEWRIPAVAATLSELTNYIASRAQALGMQCWPEELRAPHLIGIRHPRMPEYILRTLTERHIYLSRRGDSLRISPHLYNTRADIDRLFEVLEEEF